jgi:predicted membrane-bound mannosyltransferase/sugar lactone lactonase YvrE
MESHQIETPGWLDKPLTSFLPKFNIETGLVIVILIAAVVSRFYGVGARDMSHDEVNHVVPSYSLYSGNGYAYDPVTHGPFQFHMIALSYFLFGDSDTSSRIPAVVFSIATVAVALFGYRRFLGRSGALVAGFLMLISPFMLFYGRYTRNEGFSGLWTLLIIYAALRYLEKGEKSALYLLTVVMALHFTDKATAFIYNAQLMLFMGFVFLDACLHLPWPQKGSRNRFLAAMLGAVVLLGADLGIAVLNADKSTPAAGTEIPGAAPAGLNATRAGEIILVAAAAVLVIYALYLLVRNMGWVAIRRQRSFDLIMLAGSLTLPMLSAFPMRMLGLDPLDYSAAGMAKTSIFLVVLVLLAIAIGLWWKPRFWLGAAAIFYAIFTVFYTTFFTNGKGFFMGLVASLGYWLSQQGVQRGSQPWYYYSLIQIPIYEYLPAIGAILAFVIAYRHKLFSHFAGLAPAHQPEVVEEPAELGEPVPEEVMDPELVADGPITHDVDQGDVVYGEEPLEQSHLPGWLRATLASEPDVSPSPDEAPRRVPILALLLFWSGTSLVAYSVAGEKMPWLTVHITSGMILAAGWGLGYLIDTTAWKELLKRRGLLVILLLPVFVASVSGLFMTLLGSPAPFSGNTLDALSATSNFLLGVVGTVASLAALFYLLSSWAPRNVIRLLMLAVFAFMAVLTARTAYQASFINYDFATEFLVYAHGAPGPKEALAQIEEISKRTTGGLDIAVAYDNETNYPYWWYLRHYPNKKYYGDTPTADLRNAPVIAVGDPNYAKIEPIVKDNYIMYEYTRLWWPMQDYFDLTPARIWNAIKDPNMRQALINIWLNRDYTLYSQITGNKSLTLETWSPAAKMRLYIRKDIAAQMWNYGAVPNISQTTATDPYEKGMVKMANDKAFGEAGTAPGQFNAPRGVAVAPDGSQYVADSRNNRIQHLSVDGKVLQTWGTFADVAKGAAQAPGGTFNEPWGIAVAKDGSVYVTDTWNHRVQKFSADGKFLTMWGYFGQAEKPDALWGPRGIAVDAQGRVFVVDTGNKRVVIFGPNGESVSSFGSAGIDPGQFDEQVGVAFDSQGRVYITDTWNQRVQVFQPDATGTAFTPLRQWDISGWFGQSLDNKPFIAVDATGNVYVTDPESGRVLQFNSEGVFQRGWSDLLGDIPALLMPDGLAVDAQGGLWVTDASGNRLVHFNLPLIPLPSQVQPQPTAVQSQVSPQTSPTSNQPQIGPQASPTPTGQ